MATTTPTFDPQQDAFQRGFGGEPLWTITGADFLGNVSVSNPILAPQTVKTVAAAAVAIFVLLFLRDL